MKVVFCDTETTGLDPEKDELLEVAIIDEVGSVLLHSLVKPARLTEWPEAEAVNGITPAMVAHAPTLQELAPQIAQVLRGKRVVMYHAGFDSEFLRPCLEGLTLEQDYQIDCAMRRFSAVRGVWDDRVRGRGDYKRWSLKKAAEHVGHIWTGAAHRALADAEACRHVWIWTLLEGLS